jgi:hypothetical protein
VSNSSTLYEQLLVAQIPKAQKTVKFSVFFELLGSVQAKAAHITLMKLTPGLIFINILRTAFTLVDAKSVKRY